MSCENGHLETTKWLTTLCNDYSIEEEDSKIKSWKIKNAIIDLLEKGEYEKVLEKQNITPISTEEVCGICLSKEEDIQIKTNCGHIFCASCILLYKYERQSNTCPYCKQKLGFV